MSRVLVVDDDEHFAAAAKRGLEAEGFAVDLAADGDAGLWLPGSSPTTPSCSTSCCRAPMATRSVLRSEPRATGRQPHAHR